MATLGAKVDPVQALYALWREGKEPEWRAFVETLRPRDRDVLLDVIRTDQRARWERGQRILVETYLDGMEEVRQDPEALLDAIYGEFCLRDELGDEPQLGEYLARFPVHAHAIRRQFEVHRLFAEEEPDPAVANTLLGSHADDADPEKTLHGAPRADVDPSKTIAEPWAGSDAGDLPIGLVGEYELLSEIDRGGMGIVYRARHRRLPRTVALKMIQADARIDTEQRSRFRFEYETLAQLNHPNVIQIFDVGDREGQPYFTMELADGGSLAKRINGKPQPPRDAAELVTKLAEAVETTHRRGILHRDLKPANVLLFLPPNVASAPTTLNDWIPKLTDFGLAKFDPERSGSRQGSSAWGQTRSGVILGTPSYMAPEQAQGKVHAMTPATDVYALGAILYELLTGRPPFLGDSGVATLQQVLIADPVPPRRLQPTVPRDLETICLRCLQKDPARRYAAAQALAEDLGRFCRGEPIQARPVGMVEKGVKWVRRHPSESILVGAILGLLLLGMAGVLVAWRRAEADFTELRSAWTKKEASDREAETQRQARELDRYYRSVDHAEREWRTGQLPGMRSFLDDTPDRYRGWEWRYLDQLWHANRWLEPPGERDGHVGRIAAISYSPDGRYLASASFDGTVKLWDASTYQVIRTLTGTGGPILALAWHPKGDLLATGDRDKVAALWDVKTGDCISRLEGHGDMIVHLAFNRSGERLATGSVDRTARIYDVKSGQCLHVLAGHDDAITFVAFNPDGTILATASKDTTVKLWNVATGEELRTLKGHTGYVTALCFLLDRPLLVSASRDRTLKLWDVPSGRELETLRRHVADVMALALDGTGQILASAAGDIGPSEVKLLNVTTWEEVMGPRGHPRSVTAMSFHPVTGQLALAGQDEQIRIWNQVEGSEARRLAKLGASGKAVAFHPKGQELAVAGFFPHVDTWDFRHAKPLQTHAGHSNWVSAIAYSPDGAWLASAGEDQTILLRRPEGTADPRKFTGHLGAINAIAFSPDSQLLASGCEDQSVRLWTVEDGSYRELQGHKEGVTAIAFHPRELLMATADADGMVVLWDLSKNQQRTLAPPTGQPVYALAFSPDGLCLATASGTATKGEIKLWDVGTGEVLRTLSGHQGRVLSLAFEPKPSGRLASGGVDRMVILWDWQSGYEALKLRGHGGEVAGVAFDPTGQILATIASDGEVRLWGHVLEEPPSSDSATPPPSSSAKP